MSQIIGVYILTGLSFSALLWLVVYAPAVMEVHKLDSYWIALYRLIKMAPAWQNILTFLETSIQWPRFLFLLMCTGGYERIYQAVSEEDYGTEN